MKKRQYGKRKEKNPGGDYKKLSVLRNGKPGDEQGFLLFLELAADTDEEGLYCVFNILRMYGKDGLRRDEFLAVVLVSSR